MDKTEDWYVLEWKDEAHRINSMAGPKYALDDHAAELKKNKVDYTLTPVGTVTTRTAGEHTPTKEVGGVTLEVREDPGT